MEAMASNALSHKRALTTIHDVAEAAGVSIGTVSKALRGKGRLRDTTRERVRTTANRLGFRPNDLAHSLHRKRSLTVGLLSNDSYGRFSIPLLEGIQQTLGNAGMSVFLCNAFDDPERERQHVESLLAKRVDGVIVTSRRTDPRPPVDLGNVGVPLLYAFTRVDDRGSLSLVPDDFGGAHTAVTHLTRLGRRRIAHITGPERFESARLRRKGFEAALIEQGLAPDPALVLMGPWSELWGHEAATRLLDANAGIDGVFCGSDQIARGVVDRLRERGVAVPGDVAVVGYDNWEVVAAATRPALTSIDMNLQELGREAGAELLAMIDGGHRTGTRKIPCKLVVRQSCGADKH
jgi:LacI family transcriptional regulator